MQKRTGLLFLVSVVAAGVLMAADQGTVRGKVTDSQGGFVSGVAVSATNEATGAVRSTTTSERGEYVIGGLVPGVYTVTADCPGFKRVELRGVRVRPGSSIVRNIQLEVGALTETIAVQASAAATPLFPVQLVKTKFETEAYDRIDENPFLDPRKHPLSTFSIDVDTASYANVRRLISDEELPPQDAVRIEELINYFSYDYAAPAGETPFSVTTEIGRCPWNPRHRLALIGLQAKRIDTSRLPPSNLVFLLDVSGSMDEPRKLPLLVSAMKMLVQNLRSDDHVAIVVYAGASGLVLPSTPGSDKQKIIGALDQLAAGGSTNGGEGIELAYDVARESFIKGGTNRVILASDGDFNVGITDMGSLTRLIEERRETGVFLSVLGFGEGNLKDATMEKLADRGNGNYNYIDSLLEARKVLVSQMAGTLVTVAKDVKIQVEFNPLRVAAYRLIGYENRLLSDEDFNDDRKDAGEMGAGHSVTALYEVVPPGEKTDLPSVDPLKYQKEAQLAKGAPSGELMTVKVRFKSPEGGKSRLIGEPVKDAVGSVEVTSPNLGFAAAVAEFGLLLRGSEHKGDASFEQVLESARRFRGEDREGYRAEFIRLVELTKELARAESTEPGE